MVFGSNRETSSLRNSMEERLAMLSEDFVSTCNAKDKRSQDLQFAVGLKSAEIEILNHKSEEFATRLKEKEKLFLSMKENFEKAFDAYIKV